MLHPSLAAAPQFQSGVAWAFGFTHKPGDPFPSPPLPHSIVASVLFRQLTCVQSGKANEDDATWGGGVHYMLFDLFN